MSAILNTSRKMALHRYTQADVERALTRFKTLTGDSSATLITERGEGHAAAVVYRIENSKSLRGFIAYGAYSACNGLEMCCNGYEDGMAATAPAKAKRGAG